MYLVLMSRFVAPRRRHSFPTRRSSDLTPAPLPRSAASRSRSSARRPTNSPARRITIRSEEHTSELQSLRHLVCRLLLEKKKKRIVAAGNVDNASLFLDSDLSFDSTRAE